MSLGYDGSIRIDTKLDRRNFNDGIKAMTKSVKGLASAVGVALGVGAITLFSKSAVKAASDMASAMTGLQSVVQGTGKSFTEAQKFINDYIADGLVPATNAITAYKNLALRGYSTEQIEKTLIALKDSASFGRQASLTLGQAVSSATEGLKNENSILVDNAGVTKNVSVMWKEYAKSIGTTVEALTKQQKIQAEVAGIMAETRFQTGDAAKLTQGYAGMVASLATSFYNLKVAVGNIIIPLLSAIIPIVKAAIDGLVVLVNQLGLVLSMLFGVQIGNQGLAESSSASAAATEEQTEALEDAQKAAKGALAAFDELNVLQLNEEQATGGQPDMPTTPGITEGGGTAEDLGGLKSKIDALKAAMSDLFGPLAESARRVYDALKPLMQNVWEGLKWAWDNILVPLGEWTITELLPAFLDLLAAAITVLNSVIEALKPLGLWLFEEFLKPVAEWTGDKIIKGLEWLTDRLYDLSGWINKHQGTVQTITKVILGFAAGWTAVNVAVATWNTISAIATAATTAFGVAVAILTSPITLIILAIGGLVAAVYLLITHWDDLKRTAAITWILIKALWSTAVDWFKETVADPIADLFSITWFMIETVITQAWQNAKMIWLIAKTWFTVNVIDPLKSAFDTAWTTIKDGATTAFTGIKTFVKGIINGIIELLNGMISAIVSGVNVAISALNTLHIDIPGFDAGPLGKFSGYSFGLNINPLTAPTIPKLAAGAVIPPNAAFAAILGDQRNGRNLEAPEGLLRQIVREEMGSQNVNVRFTGSMAELVRILNPEIEREKSRVGTSLIETGAS